VVPQGGLRRRGGRLKALEFLTGYLIEKSLAVDNIFVFLMIFSFFAVPAEYQRRVLIYGVIAAIVMRAVMILAGAWLVQEFHGSSTCSAPSSRHRRQDADGRGRRIGSDPARARARPTRPTTAESSREERRARFAPAWCWLIESDLIFVVDRSCDLRHTDPFIVFTSNIFAILGLRAMYFMLAGMADRFHLLKYGLAMVLVFVGTKMLIVDFYKIPVGLSLGIVGLVIASFMFASLWVTRKRSGPG
jgi:predicted tellurium resistance membrane protein TerC